MPTLTCLESHFFKVSGLLFCPMLAWQRQQETISIAMLGHANGPSNHVLSPRVAEMDATEEEY